MSKHTPGPWHWDDGEDEDMPTLIAPSGEVCDFGNCEQYYPTAGKPPNNADARLIAAAPELLEALQVLHDKTAELIAHLQATDRLRPCFNFPALDSARAAIAKVNGGVK